MLHKLHMYIFVYDNMIEFNDHMEVSLSGLLVSAFVSPLEFFRAI